MVDLVKLRKKAKERKDGKEAAEDQPQAGGRSSKGAKKQPRGGSKRPPRAKKPVPAGKAPRESSKEKRKATRVDRDARGAEPPAVARSGVVSASAAARLEEFKRTAGLGSEEELGAVDVEEEGSNQLELLTFMLAGESYAVEIEKIVEIISPKEATRVPNAGKTILGIISLRGTIVTLLDLRRLLGHGARDEEPSDARIVVVENRGDHSGFLVDRVSRVIKVRPDQVETHPVVSASEQSEFIRGVFDSADTLTILLDLYRLCAEP